MPMWVTMRYQRRRVMSSCSSSGIAALLVLCSIGCINATYRPVPSGRLVAHYERRGLVYSRDGRSFEAGFFGGGLIDAVDGNPAAVSRARSARSRLMVAYLVAVTALGCSLDALFRRREGSGLTKVGYIEGTVCLSSLSIAQWLRFSAHSKRLDAINLYNDSAGSGRAPRSTESP